jgi:Methyltransferase domain
MPEDRSRPPEDVIEQRQGARHKGATAKTAEEEAKMGTAQIQGELWGARAREWAELQEGAFLPLYEAAFEAAKVTKGTRLLEAGCGAGLALQVAAKRGASVSGIDAAQSLVAIARERLAGADIRVGESRSCLSPMPSSTSSPASTRSNTRAIGCARSRKPSGSPSLAAL